MGLGLKLWRYMGVAILMPFCRLQCAEGFPDVLCYFVFGDSLADSGNNNDLETLSKANYQPYGIDFPDGSTGRFTNGRTYVDFLVDYLDLLRYIPPYASSHLVDLIFGINYASGAAGILNETSEHRGERIPFDKQLENHRSVISRLVEILGSKKLVEWYMGKCLYTVGLGINDYLNNYFVPDYYNSSQEYTLSQFTQLLIDQYTCQIKRLYSYGARKIAIFGLGSLGCTPNAISKYGTNGSSCVEKVEEASKLFNTKLIAVVDQLNSNFTDSFFTYINYYSIGAAAASVQDFTNTTSACCPADENGLCIPHEVPCSNRTAYVFWDAIHPTDAFNKYIAERAYSALEPSDAQPYDIKSLVELNTLVSAF